LLEHIRSPGQPLAGQADANSALDRARDHLLEIQVAGEYVWQAAGCGRVGTTELGDRRRATRLVIGDEKG
jgi:hypothetical protein